MGGSSSNACNVNSNGNANNNAPAVIPKPCQTVRP